MVLTLATERVERLRLDIVSERRLAEVPRGISDRTIDLRGLKRRRGRLTIPRMRISVPGQRSSSSRRTISVWTCKQRHQHSSHHGTRGWRESLLTMASFELRVPRVNTCPAYLCVWCVPFAAPFV